MKTTAFRSAPDRGAFTLIELLVAIAIIAMLATLLVPVAGRVIGKTDDIKCANNLRQLGMIIQTVAIDNSGLYPQIENDPKSPVHTEDDGKVWSMPELLLSRGVSTDILKCPADERAKLSQSKGAGAQSYFAAKGSSYEWLPYYEGENVNAVKRYGRGGVRTLPPARVRLLMDYAENGEAPHDRSADASTMKVVYADGSVREAVLVKGQ